MTVSKSQVPRAAEPLAGGGELGRLMRGIDWSRTPLGPVAGWPRALRTAVRIMLTSRQPMFVWWGDQLINLYNDAYRSILGGKHPAALGQPASLVWREIWDAVGPRAAAAMSGNEGTYDEALLLIMERNGYPEETYYTFSYSPVPNDEGGAGGILCANTEDTRRIIGERQLGLLRDLAAATGDARSIDEACRMAGQGLRSNPRDLPFALIYLQEPSTDHFGLAATAGIEPGHPAAAVTVSAQPGPWPLAEVLRDGALRVIEDLSQLQDLPRGAWPLPPSRAVAIPLPASGETGRAGILVAGLNPYRLLDDDYQGFLRLVAGQIAAAVSNAQAYEEERRRAEALAELDRAKTVFFSNVSHEFRTPLTLLLGPLEDLLAQAASLAPEVRTEVDVAHRNALRLLKLVNSLLDFSRIEAGRVQASVEPTDLPALTAELAATFRSAIERAGLRLEVHCPPLPQPVYVDREMWEKVVLNLLSNAFKYTFNGSIEVSVAPSQDGLAAELRVRDTGIGIPADELPRLFERFHRVSGARGRSHEGTGIGLALVQDLVKLHRGGVSVASEPGRGSTFTVRIPFGTGHLPERRPSQAVGLASSATRADTFVEEALHWSAPTGEHPAVATLAPRPRVLFADDNADMREYVHRLLEPLYQVTTVADGEDALARVRADRPDLLITDVMMPRLDGVGLVQAIRADPSLRTLPVIMLSARAGEESRVSGLETGADDYLVKPFAARELIARVAATLHLAEIRAEAGEALRQSERRYRSLVQATAQIVWATDRDGEFSEPSASWEAYTGQPWEEYRGGGGMDTVHPDDRQRVSREWGRAVASGAPIELEYRLRRADGHWRRVLTRGVPVRGEDGRIREWVGTTADVEEQRLAEERLRQSAKMEAIGRLAGGLAHDFNNQLQAVSGFVNFIDRDGTLPAGYRRDLHEIRKAAERMASLTRQLLAFSRQQVLSPETLDLNAAVADSQSLLQRLIGADVEMVVMLGSGPKWVQVDRAQLLQVLMNLSINARDAMPDGGELVIRTGVRESAGGLPGDSTDPVVPAGYASLTVTDTGSGIAAEHLRHIFEPFFTTKEVGRGTGLGLATVHGIVAQSRGHIWVESTVGEGTTFTVLLPLVPQPPERAVADTRATALSPGPARVLVVDDEEAVRQVVGRMLTDGGYVVSLAQHGRDAMTLLEQAGGGIDLIVSDVVMPLLGGEELRTLLARTYPHLPVIWTSGYPRDAVMEGDVLGEDQIFLQKPVSADVLLSAAARLTGRGAARESG
jgi:PAS domain S-box-containing protein